MIRFQSEQLRTFLTVLENGTFDAAAHSLHVTASAVSQRIKAMEHVAGQVLLLRTTPITTTPAGTVVLKLARQLRQLEDDAAAELEPNTGTRGSLTIVVNADSLATWFMDALALLPNDGRLNLELVREDEQHSVNLLRSGAVMAAVTATATPVQGCSATPLGTMNYRAIASANLMEQWFPKGFTAEQLTAAPVIQFDRSDTLQNNFLAQTTGQHHSGPQHFIPDTIQFAEAVKLGLGWGMMPEAHCQDGLRSGNLVELRPGSLAQIPLFWQRWKIQSQALDVLSVAVAQAAAEALG